MWIIEEGTKLRVTTALKNRCYKTEKNNPHPIILLVLYFKVQSFAQSQWEILCCLHTPLPLGRFSTQTSYHKHHGNKVKKTTSVGLRQEGVVFFGVWDKVMPGHLFWQVCGCCLRAAVGENKREQRMLLSMEPRHFPGLPAVLGQGLWLLQEVQQWCLHCCRNVYPIIPPVFLGCYTFQIQHFSGCCV